MGIPAIHDREEVTTSTTLVCDRRCYGKIEAHIVTSENHTTEWRPFVLSYFQALVPLSRSTTVREADKERSRNSPPSFSIHCSVAGPRSSSIVRHPLSGDTFLLGGDQPDTPMTVDHDYGLFIDGDYRDGIDTFSVENPATEESIATVSEGGRHGIDLAVTAATEALDEWRELPPKRRGEILREIGDYISEYIDELAELETAEMGRPISQSQRIIANSVKYFTYYSGIPTKIEGETIPVPGERLNYTRREPLGVTGHIIPWNASLKLGIRSIVPALACGNTVVAKPSPKAPLSLVRFAELASRTGLPDGVFNVVPGDGPTTGKPLTTDSRISGFSFTGSVPTGKQVGKAAIENVCPVNLELGGTNPTIVFPDVDLDEAVDSTVKVYMNSGQVCFAATRVFVHEDIYDAFTATFEERVKSLSIGAGNEDPDIGPLISATAVDNTVDYVENAIEAGAHLRAGGYRPDRTGHFYKPTLIDDVDDDTRISREEVFGPVAMTYEFASEEEVIRRANDTDYGLYAVVWTDKLDRAHRVAHAIDAGSVVVNEYPATFPQAPFGGFKQSGIGKEKGMQAIEHYTQTKNITIAID